VTVLQWAEGLLGTLIVRRSNQQGIMRKLAGREEILKDEKCLSRKTSVLDFFKLSSGTRASPHVLLDNGADAVDGLPAVQQEVFPPQVVISLSLFLNFRKYKYIFIAC
jgi:hypothetical protein